MKKIYVCFQEKVDVLEDSVGIFCLKSLSSNDAGQSMTGIIIFKRGEVYSRC
jgi:hypothetical protein